jgi:hypothetical protein
VNGLGLRAIRHAWIVDLGPLSIESNEIDVSNEFIVSGRDAVEIESSVSGDSAASRFLSSRARMTPSK